MQMKVICKINSPVISLLNYFSVKCLNFRAGKHSCKIIGLQQEGIKLVQITYLLSASYLSSGKHSVVNTGRKEGEMYGLLF
jgi:hypothetical protein